MKGSLRTRLFAGALVWMAAVFAALTALLLKVARNHPELGLNGPTYHVLMGIFAIAFVVGGLFLIGRALAPFTTLRAGLSAVREGRSQRIEGDHPAEVQPLVNDLNGLLEDRERAVARALTTAGDLAHGLKTPLAVLAQEAEQADAAGHHDLAATLRQLVERMQRQVDYHLARARATASARATLGLRCSVLPSVEGLVRTMLRLHAERELRIDAEVSPAHEIRGRREDLDEMLGNLLDNACKWAHTRVAVSSVIDDGQLSIAVDDDGPGLDPALRAQVLQRGVRADERVLDAMGSVPRDRFVLERDRRRAYDDCALTIGHGQTISQPWIVAAISQALELRGDERVLEVGTGSGYSTAVLTRLAAEVISIERHAELAESARQRLAGLGVENAEVVVGDGTLGMPGRAPFDGIGVHATAPAPPRTLLAQLGPAGRLVAPVAADAVDVLTRFRNPAVLITAMLALCVATLATNIAANVVSKLDPNVSGPTHGGRLAQPLRAVAGFLPLFVARDAEGMAYSSVTHAMQGVDDVRWAMGLLSGLTDRQWHDAFRAGGYDEALAARFIAKLQANIAEGRKL